MRTKSFSKSCFFDALISLSKVYDYKDIKISQICKEAGFDRSTFYRLYKSKEDILKENAEDVLKEFYAQRKMVSYNINKKCELVFAFFRQHNEIFSLLLKANMYYELQELSLKYFLFEELITEHVNDEYEKVFLINGFISVLMCWLKSGMTESDELMAKRTLSMINIKKYTE